MEPARPASKGRMATSVESLAPNPRLSQSQQYKDPRRGPPGGSGEFPTSSLTGRNLHRSHKEPPKVAKKPGGGASRGTRHHEPPVDYW